MARTRNHSVLVRMSDAEYDAFCVKLSASGQSQQSFVLSAVNDAVIATPEVVAELKQLNSTMQGIYKQLKGMGTNINQIATKVNATQDIPEQEMLKQILEEIESIRKEEYQTWQYLKQSINPLRTKQD